MEQLSQKESDLNDLRARLEQVDDRLMDAVLREQRKLRALLGTRCNAVIVVDAQGAVDAANSEAERLFSYLPLELVGVPAGRIFPGYTSDLEELDTTETGSAPTQPWTKLMGCRKDGSEILVERLSSTILLEGVPLVFVRVRESTWHGVTRQAESEREPTDAKTPPCPACSSAASLSDAEDAAQRVSALLAAIVDSSDDAIIAKTLGGIITSFNPGATRMYGYEAVEVIGRSMSLLIPSDRPDELPDILARVGRGERIDHYETTRIRKDGSVVHVSVSASPIRGSGGTIIGVSAIARDVTSRKALEASRQVVEDRLHAVLESAPLVLFSYDMDLRFTSYRAGKVLPDFVAREADCIGRSVLQLHAGDHGLSEQLQRSLRGERVVTEVEVLGHMLEVRFAPEFDAAGRQIGVNGVTIDISDQVKARKDQEHLAERLRQHERLESVGQLAGGIAHDFNNLLAVIINCAFFVTREIDDKEAIRADIAHIERAAERAAQLTRQLLAFARRENLQPQVVDMNLAVSGIEPMLRRTLGEHVILLTELGPDLWPVLVDPGQFEQVLVNLAVNARDAMPHGGVLTIDTENVEIDEALRSLRPDLAVGRYVRVRVSDNGTGIEKSVLEHIFEPFFTTKPAGEGTGLGLATVFGIVAQAGGDVQIYSELGVGTTCRVLLPACEGAPMPVLEPREIRSLFGTETVLVVEDEDPLRDVARRLLVDNGYTVFVTGSGEEALRLVGELDGPIDLLLTDVVMPHMLGTEVATRLKEQQPGLMVLYMSGHAHTVLGPILDSSAALVEKPFTERSLLEKVREVLEAGR